MKENVSNVSEKQENMRLKCEFKKKNNKVVDSFWTGDFNWLETCELKTKIAWKTIKNYRTIYGINDFLFVCIKCLKSEKKHMKNVKLELLMIKNTFGSIEEIYK